MLPLQPGARDRRRASTSCASARTATTSRSAAAATLLRWLRARRRLRGELGRAERRRRTWRRSQPQRDALAGRHGRGSAAPRRVHGFALPGRVQRAQGSLRRDRRETAASCLHAWPGGPPSGPPPRGRDHLADLARPPRSRIRDAEVRRRPRPAQCFVPLSRTWPMPRRTTCCRTSARSARKTGSAARPSFAHAPARRRMPRPRRLCRGLCRAQADTLVCCATLLCTYFWLC